MFVCPYMIPGFGSMIAMVSAQIHAMLYGDVEHPITFLMKR